MTVANAILQGIFLGAFYAVLACGLSLMFGVMRIITWRTATSRSSARTSCWSSCRARACRHLSRL